MWFICNVSYFGTVWCISFLWQLYVMKLIKWVSVLTWLEFADSYCCLLYPSRPSVGYWMLLFCLEVGHNVHCFLYYTVIFLTLISCSLLCKRYAHMSCDCDTQFSQCVEESGWEVRDASGLITHWSDTLDWCANTDLIKLIVYWAWHDQSTLNTVFVIVIIKFRVSFICSFIQLWKCTNLGWPCVALH